MKLTAYNILGQRVTTLFDDLKQAGDRYATFDAKNLSSGIYIYRLELMGVSLQRKMTMGKYTY